MTYLVSILIPTLIERKSVFNELIDSIHKQIKQGKYETFFAATAASVKKLEKRIVTTTKENVTWARDIAESGGFIR